MATKGAMKRDPKVSIQPVKTGKEQVMERTLREKPMERLSPGVYRGAQGGLVTQAGRPIERQLEAPISQAPAPQINDLMYRMFPQPSANYGGQYRLSPGMYGSREQALQQYNQQMQQMMARYAKTPQGEM